MMNCKEIKDLILTDYIDGRLDTALKAELESHLCQCPACQTFAQEAKEYLKTPFQQANRQEVPAQLWENIKDSIEAEQTPGLDFLGAIKGWLYGLSLPKLIPVFASFAILFFIGSNLLINQQVKQAQNEEQVIYLASVFSTADGVGVIQSDDQEMPIEKYFL